MVWGGSGGTSISKEVLRTQVCRYPSILGDFALYGGVSQRGCESGFGPASYSSRAYEKVRGGGGGVGEPRGKFRGAQGGNSGEQGRILAGGDLRVDSLGKEGGGDLGVSPGAAEGDFGVSWRVQGSQGRVGGSPGG